MKTEKNQLMLDWLNNKITFVEALDVAWKQGYNACFDDRNYEPGFGAGSPYEKDIPGPRAPFGWKPGMD